MTDEELAEALSVASCHRQGGWCATHRSFMSKNSEFCRAMSDGIRCARFGIDLAREGIASEIMAARVPAGNSWRRTAAKIARGWGQ